MGEGCESALACGGAAVEVYSYRGGVEAGVIGEVTFLFSRSRGGDNCRGGKGSGSSHRSDLTDGSRVSRGGVRRPVFMLWMDGSENDEVVEGIVRVTDII